ncbi:methyltransferase domain-containing protein [Amylibacter sp.]|nr:methyltransferase domain-containing protein [Amylibacter sp.]
MKLHLGCGKRDFEGWVNVDLADYPHIQHISSVNDLSMFEDNSADIIYSSHTLEYFDRNEAFTVLTEWRRVLKPEGILRVAVPNFKALIKVYDQTDDLSNILGPMYGKMMISRKEDSENIYHKTIYDFNSLSKLLMSVGYKNVIEYDWRKTEHSKYDDHSQAYFPHMDKNNGLLVSLNIEAIKC